MASPAGGWKAILLLSVIIPVSVFTGLKLAGISGPAPVETTTLNPVAWQFYRTSGWVDVNERVNATYRDDACDMLFSVYVAHYVPGIAGPPYTVRMLPSFAASPLGNNFAVKSITFSFGQDAQPSQIDVLTDTDSYENLSFAGDSSGSTAYAQFIGNGSSGGVNCQFEADWDVFTGNNVTNYRQVTFDVIYFNGTAYKEVVQPFDLTLLGGAYARLDIGSVVWGQQAGEAISGVNVWVDGQLYSTPVSGLIVTQGIHNITAPLTINLNGTAYRFYGWSLGELDNSIPLNITSDLSITATYEPALVGS
jgi:hypothetical protein